MSSPFPRRLLMVDDEPLVAKAVSQRLERRGFFVANRDSGDGLLEVIAAERIEMVLLDIVMPGRDGISVLRELRAKHKHNDLPVVMVTQISDSQDISEAFRFGANDYLTKPINLDVAAARIHAHLSLCDLQRTWAEKAILEDRQAVVAKLARDFQEPVTSATVELERLISAGLSESAPEVQRIQLALKHMSEIIAKIHDTANTSDQAPDPFDGNPIMLRLKK